MQHFLNINIESSFGKPFLADIYYQASSFPKPVIIFAHGFKGFKDWGHWSLIAKQFAQAGFLFVSFNFSHNGTTISQPLDFADLEAFGNNNFSKELTDLDAILNWITQKQNIIPVKEMDTNKIALIGHSRGGGINIIKAKEDDRIKTLVSWAGVHRLDYAWQNEAEIKEWKRKGVQYILNGRTMQQMPLFYQLYQDFKNNKVRFDTEKALKNLEIPMLIIQGTDDPAVPLSAAKQMKKWNPNANLHIIQGANHVFGGNHPYENGKLPSHSAELVQKTIDFLIAN